MIPVVRRLVSCVDIGLAIGIDRYRKVLWQTVILVITTAVTCSNRTTNAISQVNALIKQSPIRDL